MSAIRLVLIGALALTLVGCAGSPLRNAVDGKGLVCTMDNCAQSAPRVASTAPTTRLTPRYNGPRSSSCKSDHDLEASLTGLNSMYEGMQHEAWRFGEKCEENLRQQEAKRQAYLASLSPPPKNGGVLPKNYKQLVYAWADDNLKDPFTAKYKFGEWYSGYIERVKPTPSTPVAVLFVSVNSKNSYGAYGGYTIYRCAIIPHAAVCHDYTPIEWKFDEKQPLTPR